MVTNIDNVLSRIETHRIKTQHRLDAAKTQLERNKMGQFATPPDLAAEILEFARASLSSSQPIRFLDPAFGTGSFYAALLKVFPSSQISQAWGYEIDPLYGREAVTLWENTFLKLTIADYTRIPSPDSENSRANLLICNPPYVRHHHMAAAEKLRLQADVEKTAGVKLSGLTGLYGYFLLRSHDWLAAGALAGWLIPSEFMDVNYGLQIKQYLLQNVTLLRIHRFDPNHAQFADALVSSAVVWFKKEKPPKNYNVEFSYGGTLVEPEKIELISAEILRTTAKWTTFPKTTVVSKDKGSLRLSDFFKIKRGLVTGANKFFILTPRQIAKYDLPSEFLRPILPSPRYLPADEIETDEKGNPVLERQLFLLACSLPEDEVKSKYPSLWEYFQLGVRDGTHERYLCRHRWPWYAQEDRPASPLLCTYMGRKTSNGKPFRFILNHSQATVPNVYLMLYPKPVVQQKIKDTPALLEKIWYALKEIPVEVLTGEGRVYGGGLHKIEPNELANVSADIILKNLPELSDPYLKKQLSLFD